LIDHLSFLLFSDAPPASLHIPRLILPTSVSSSKSPPVVPDYTMKPLVTQVYSHRRTHLSDAPTSSAELSFDVSSSSLNVPHSPPGDSSSEQLLGCGHRLCRPPDCYSPSTFTVAAVTSWLKA
jgi:hypothetical protein